jgi:GNAT superfamily N-acetyltransferase
VTTFEIRDGVAGDMAVLRQVFRRSSLSNDGERAKLLAHPEVLELSDLAVTQGRIRAAVSDGVIAGFASWLPGEHAVELEDLFVDPDWMRQGAGRALVLDVAGIASALGTRRVEVTANQDARAFYITVGFVVAGYVQTTFGPALRMHLDLM